MLVLVVTVNGQADDDDEVEVVDASEASSDSVDNTNAIVEDDNELSANAEELLKKVVRYGLDQSDFLTDVQEKALYDEGIRLTKRDPAHFVAVFNKQKQRTKELSKLAYASLEASSLLARQ